MMAPVAIGFWSLELAGFLWIAVTIVWVCGIVDLITKRPDLDGRHRAAWILIIVLFPVIGTLHTSSSGPLSPLSASR